jgi:4-amino-4-deoxy-L-arabinose transferase-like glycosyltransferase
MRFLFPGERSSPAATHTAGVRVLHSQTVHILALILLASGLAAAVWLMVPYSAPVTGAHLRVLDDLIAGRQIAYTPYPVGYSYFAALSMRWGGMNGLFLANAVVYISTVVLTYSILRSLGLDRAAFAGALAVACYPHLFLNVKKYIDTGFSALLLVAFALYLVRIKRGRFNAWRAVTGGLLFAAMLLQRPNLLVLAPIAVFAAFQIARPSLREILFTLSAVAVAAVALAAVIVPLKGRFVVFDSYYGASTFLHGTHRHAFEGILRDYNGELMIDRTLKEVGIPFAGLDEIVPGMADRYLQLGWEYINEDRLRYVALLGFKLVNLFRPDFRDLSSRSFVSAPVLLLVQLAISGIFVAWVVLRWRCRRFLKLSDGFMAVPFLLLYIVPFVLTNTDTRYRIPFDPLFLVDAVFCLAVLKEGGRQLAIFTDVSALPKTAGNEQEPSMIV